MKQLANSFAQLTAIIMLMIMLAVSTAAISQWANADANVTVSSTTQPSPISSTSAK